MNIKPLKSRLLLHSRETLVEEKSRDFQENVLACLGFGWGDADVSATRLNRAPVSQSNNHAKESRWTLDTYLPKSDCLPPEGMWT